MNKFLLSLLIVLVISGVCVVSCPDRDAHYKAISDDIQQTINSELIDQNANDSKIALSFLASSFLGGVSDFLVNNTLSVDNYFLFSLGKITIHDKTKIVSIGLLNHVFTEIGDVIKDELTKQQNSSQHDTDTNKKSERQNKAIIKAEEAVKEDKVEVVEEEIVEEEIVEEIIEEPINNIRNNEPVYVAVEQMPQFPGGEASLMRFLRSNINYPQEAYENGVQGRVIVQFVVQKDGSVGEVKIIRSVNHDLDKEAIRLCKSIPKFIPGKMNGQAVNVWYTLPITFKIQ